MKFASMTPQPFRMSFASTIERFSITPRKISLTSNTRPSLVFEAEHTVDKNSKKRVPKESDTIVKKFKTRHRRKIERY
jgi:hypothetical protein